MNEFEYSIKDKDNPKSLVNLTTQVVSERIAAIPDEVLQLSDEEIEAKVGINITERQLRVAFMQEYERALRTNKNMLPQNIYTGIVTKRYFFAFVVGNSFKLAYIIRPFPEYQVSLEEMLQLGMDEMRKILTQPMIDAKGNFDSKLAAVKINLWKDIADRRRGSVTQKMQVESKSMNVNLTQELPRSVDEIDKRLLELEAEVPAMITVKSES